MLSLKSYQGQAYYVKLEHTLQMPNTQLLIVSSEMLNFTSHSQYGKPL